MEDNLYGKLSGMPGAIMSNAYYELLWDISRRDQPLDFGVFVYGNDLTFIPIKGPAEQEQQ